MKVKEAPKAKAKEKKAVVKTAKKAVQKTAAAQKAAKAVPAKTAQMKTGIGREMDKVVSFLKSVTLKDLADLGEDGKRILGELFGEIVRIGETMIKGMKKTKK